MTTLNRRQVLGGLSVATLLSGATLSRAADRGAPDRSTHRLIYQKPASTWLEALPVGNGRVGAMVFGGVGRERIQLNHVELWSGRPAEDDRAASRDALPEVRRLLFDGKYADANKVAEDRMMIPMNAATYGSYQTLGDLFFDFDHDGEAVSYTRELDIAAAAVKVGYRVDGHDFTRTIVASHPGQALVIHLETSSPTGLRFSVALRREKDARTDGQAGVVVLQGKPAGGGADFRAHLSCTVEGGTCVTQADGYRVEGARSATLFLTAATDLLKPGPDAQCREAMQAVRSKTWTALLAEHMSDYQRLFHTVSLRLGQDTAQPLADERLSAARLGRGMPLMAETYFNVGRYLFISSSRAGSLPPNLQGLWVDRFDPPWSADYHININLQMNYWPAEVCGLGELTEPLFDYVERLMPHARQTAAVAYGCAGAVAHYTTNPWGHTALDGLTQWGLWPDGLAWISRHFWEHYLQSGDRSFLERRAYPVLKACAEFSLDYLVAHPKTGKLVAGPATSPENAYRLTDGTTGYISMGPAMSQSIALDLLRNTAQAARTLGDEVFAQHTEQAAAQLQRLRIGADGRIMEWPEAFAEVEPGHRHISHLFGLFPGHEIDPVDTPDLADAARKTLAARLAHGGGQTGWSAAWIVMYRARLGEGDAALDMLEKLCRDSTAPNYFDTHPLPDGPVFQIDGNLGAVAAIAEMLMQSHNDRLRLLPALPKAWPDGEVRGLKARGDITVDLKWQGGRAVAASLLAARTTRCRVVAPPGQALVHAPAPPSAVVDVTLQKGRALDLTFV